MMGRARSLFFSRKSKSVLALLLLGVAVAASATVYAFFYANTTGTVRSPDVTLVAGTDASGSCSVYPCATVGISTTGDTATVTFSLFKADATFNPAPATYYTNLIKVSDGANTHSVSAVSVTSETATSSSDFGEVTIYYCTSPTSFDANGNPSATCAASLAITSSTQCSGATVCSLTGTFPQSITTSSSPHYIEMVVYAGSSASASDAITFKVAVQWA